LFDSKMSELIWYPETREADSYIVPKGVTSIGDKAFEGCESLTRISLPDSVTSIGAESFSFCSSLTQISIPEGVTSIGNRAFYRCSSLTQTSIPASVTSIGDYAFIGCPDSLVIITPSGSYAERYARENGITTSTTAPTPTPTVAPTLRKGSEGEPVAALQRRLIELGYLYDTADGKFGGKTEAAVRQFQNRVGLDATGIADSETQHKLFNSTAPTAPPTPKPTNTPKPAKTSSSQSTHKPASTQCNHPDYALITDISTAQETVGTLSVCYRKITTYSYECVLCKEIASVDQQVENVSTHSWDASHHYCTKCGFQDGYIPSATAPNPTVPIFTPGESIVLPEDLP